MRTLSEAMQWLAANEGEIRFKLITNLPYTTAFEFTATVQEHHYRHVVKGEHVFGPLFDHQLIEAVVKLKAYVERQVGSDDS